MSIDIIEQSFYIVESVQVGLHIYHTELVEMLERHLKPKKGMKTIQ
jgi:hypothetical protein